MIQTAIKSKSKTKAMKSDWCQTVEVPATQKIPEDYGSYTWGWIDLSHGAVGEQIIKVFSATSSWGGRKGSLDMMMMGDGGLSDWIGITEPSGFIKGSITIVKKTMAIVGTILSIKLKSTIPENEPQLCDKIEISMGQLIQHFPCSKLISNKQDEVFNSIGNIEQLVTADISVACKDPVWIQLVGTKGQTILSVLTDHGFTVGIFEKSFLGDFVGNIFAVKMIKTPGCAFTVKKLSIKQISDGQKLEFNQEQLVSGDYTWKSPPKQEPEPAKKKAKGAVIPPKPDPTKMEQIIKSYTSEVDRTRMNMNFDGGCLPIDLQDEARMNKLTCETKLSEKLGEFDLQQDGTPKMMHLTQVKYMTCPEGCYKEGLDTVGVIIHPVDVAICTAAWADRAINHNGGVVQVVVTKAQTSYMHHFQEFSNGVKLSNGGSSSLFSFVVAKVDNTDMVSKKVRLVNNGKIDSAGRMEVMIERQWMTVKPIVFPASMESQSAMMNRVAANACKQLGYIQGELDGSDSNQLTDAVPQRMIFCHGVNDSFPCEMKLPDGTPDDPPPVVPADHASDVKIQCTSMDPTRASMGGGKLWTPQAGKAADYAAADVEGGRALLCASAMATAGKDIAKFFCKAMGYPDIETKFFNVDVAFDYSKASATQKYAASVSGLDHAKGTITTVALSDTPCAPVQIKCKGLPDTPNIKSPARNLSRHPAPLIKKIKNCSDSPASLSEWIKGDPGSVYTFICPANCNAAGTLYGTGLQRWDSPICMAAIHNYMNTATAQNFISIVIGIPKIQFTGAKNADGIESQGYPMEKDFSISSEAITSTLSYAIIDTNTCQLAGFDPDARFLQQRAHVTAAKTGLYNLKKNEYNKVMKSKRKFTNHVKAISFLQSKVALGPQYQLWFAGAQPFFYYAPLENEVRDLNFSKEGEKIDLANQAGVELTRDLGEGQTIIVGFQLDSFPKKDQITIFSHSNNNCQEFVVQDLDSMSKPPVLQFRKKGAADSKSIFNTVWTPALGTPLHVVLSQYKGKFKMWINGLLTPTQGMGLELSDFTEETCPSALVLGNDNGNHFMKGQIQQWAAFTEVWGSEKADHFAKAVKTTLLLPKGGAGGGGLITTDGRACISPQFPKPPPPSESAPAKPEPKTEAQAEAQAELQKNMTEKASTLGGDAAGGAGGAAGTVSGSSDEKVEGIAEDLASKNPALEQALMKGGCKHELPTDESACKAKGTDFFNSAEGLTETAAGDFSLTGTKVCCPANCIEITESKMTVFGPETGSSEKSKYKFGIESSICGAAIQAGVFPNEEGGFALIHLSKQDNPNAPLASLGSQFKITPLSGDPSVGLVYISPSPPPISATCMDAAADIAMNKDDGKLTMVECQPACQDEQKKAGGGELVQGSFTNGYSYDSKICIAALHSGLLSNSKKATLSVKTMMAKDNAGNIAEVEYKCKTSAMLDECEDVKGLGIQSGTKKYSSGGFLFTEPVQACKWYKDGANVPVMKRYDTVVGEEVQKFNGSLFKPMNASTEESLIINKKFECANVTIEIAFSLSANTKKLGETTDDQFGIVFRQSKIQEEEYYMLKLNKEGMEFQKISGGGAETLVFIEQPFDLVESTNIQDIKIKQVGSQISCDIMKNEELTWKNMFTIDEQSLHRGYVGFAKKGELDLNILSFSLRDPREKKVKQQIDVQPTLKAIEFGNMEAECNQQKQPAINDLRRHDQCHTTMGWCRRSCKKLKMYKQFYWNCIKECQTNYDQYLKVKEMALGAVQSFPCKDVMPGITYESSLKIDYKPVLKCDNSNNDEGEYQPGWVAAALEEGEQCKFTVRWICHQGVAPQVVEIEETDKTRFAACGERIKARIEKCEEKVQEGKQFDELMKLKNNV